jgi:tRNA A37 threonylcarbamoyladenosine biosynthesis protein TsaE
VSEPSQQGANDATLHFLRYYCDPSNKLDYAVMVNGKWGAGKTHLINSFTGELRSRAETKSFM